MKLLLVGLLLLLTFVSALVKGDDCVLNAMQPVPYTQLKNCATSIPFSQKIKDDTLTSVKKTIPLYIFVDIAKQSPDPNIILSVDLKAGLDEITNQQFTTDFDFHQSVVSLFRKLNDGHTLYFGPKCYDNLSFKQPFNLMSYVEEGVQKIGIASLNNATFLYYKEKLNLDFSSFVNSEIISIDGENALQHLINFANVNIGGYKDLGTRFNAAITSGFTTRTTSRIGIPENEIVTYVIRKSDGSEVTIEVPWVGISVRDYASQESFYSSCFKANQFAFKKYSKLHPLHEPSPFEETVKVNERASNLNVTTVLIGDTVSYYRVGDQVSVITIDSFVPNSNAQFAKDFQLSLYLAKLSKTSRLIIDVTNNGGGDECLGYALIKYLFPADFAQNYETLFANTDMIATDIGLELAQAGAKRNDNQDSIWYPATWRSTTGGTFSDASWYSNTIEHTRGGSESKYTSLLKEGYCQPEFDDYNFGDGSNQIYSSDNIIILSNGRCASTCALFSRHLQESFKVKTVVVGGLLNTKQQIAQVPGGQVYEFEELRQDIVFYGLDGSPNAPPALPTDSRFRFAIREAYSWTNNHTDTPLEFFFEPSDFRLMYTKESAVDRTKVWIDTMQFFDVCAEWETKPCAIGNGYGVQRCGNNGKYQPGCVAVKCNTGYGLSANDNSCNPCLTGTYQSEDGITCLPCTNKPEQHASYTNSTGLTSNTCPFVCDEGYAFTAQGTCVVLPKKDDFIIATLYFYLVVAGGGLFLVISVLLLITLVVTCCCLRRGDSDERRGLINYKF
ncbi:hypothetical protein ABK040_008401 [Willaertia magna]